MHATNWRNIELSRTHQTSGKKCQFLMATNSYQFHVCVFSQLIGWLLGPMFLSKKHRKPEFSPLAMTDPMGTI